MEIEEKECKDISCKMKSTKESTGIYAYAKMDFRPNMEKRDEEGLYYNDELQFCSDQQQNIIYFQILIHPI